MIGLGTPGEAWGLGWGMATAQGASGDSPNPASCVGPLQGAAQMSLWLGTEEGRALLPGSWVFPEAHG